MLTALILGHLGRADEEARSAVRHRCLAGSRFASGGVASVRIAAKAGMGGIGPDREWSFARGHDNEEAIIPTVGVAPPQQPQIPKCRTFTGATGLEPATSGVTGRRSNQLNYAPAREAEGLYLRLAALNDLAGGIARRVVFRQGIA